MKETVNTAAGFPGETFQSPGEVRLRYQPVRITNRTSAAHKLIPFLLIALAVAALMTATMGHSKFKQVDVQQGLHTILTGNVAGHEINADIDATGFIADRGNDTGIEFLQHKLGIEKERLLLDGMERVKIPADAKLNIVLADTKLSVTANGGKTFHTTIKR